MAYISSSDVKNYGGWASTDVGDDTLIAQLIPIAQQMIDTYCNRSFEVVTTSDQNDSDTSTARVFDAEDDIEDYTLILDKDLCNIVSVSVDGLVMSSNVYVTEPRSDPPYWGITVIPGSTDDWSYGTDNENAISVDGFWTYSSSAPADIKMANILLVQWLTKMRNSDLALTAPIVDASAGVTIMPIQMPNIVKQILSAYRRVNFEVT